MRILELHAENVKRIQVIDITPGKGVVEIAGENGSGKSSTLDSLLWLIGGKGAIQWQPIRVGEERAVIKAKLGDDAGLRFIVTRRFTATEDDAKEPYTTSVVVEAADGSRPRGPQELLDSLYSGMAFDPLQFQRIPPKERIAILKALVPGVDFDALQKRRDALYDERTEVNRLARILRAQAGEEPNQDEPDVKVNEETIVSLLAAAAEEAAQVEKLKAYRQNVRDGVVRLKESAVRKRLEADELRRKADTLAQSADEDERDAERQTQTADRWPPIPDPPDTDSIKADLAAAQAHNRRVQAVLDYRERSRTAANKEAEGQELTEQIKGIDETVRAAVANANLPVRGLTLGELDVYLGGVPFGQASDAQQLRASLAIGIAMNPKLRVLRVRDGSLLDDKAMEILNEVALAEDFQVWTERVHAYSKSAIILEDGKVRG